MMADPRDLDKNRKTSTEDDTPMIVYRQPYVENGVQHEKVHGPMPVADWPAYEKENNL